MQQKKKSKKHSELKTAPLGKKSEYIDQYTPSLLYPVSREIKRAEIGVQKRLPFSGYDIWTGYELSWLNPKGKPVVAIAEFWFPCESPNLVESKSFKLYLNSLNNSKFSGPDEVSRVLKSDLSRASGAETLVKVWDLEKAPAQIKKFGGVLIDDLDIGCKIYEPNLKFLKTSKKIISETLSSNLLKSNCLVTGQPDWGSVQITYKGPKIDQAGLLRYIVSFRNHNEFHEQCVERIFVNVLERCKPEFLTVFARYTRRGGLDINPFRTNYTFDPSKLNLENHRLVRQ